VRVVDGLNQAIDHIETFGSHHTDCIITENQETANRFLKEVDSAIVVHNASTQFADGGEFGFGAEIGIATGLAWTEAGGEILMTETSLLKGKGNLTLTGSLGDVILARKETPTSYHLSVVIDDALQGVTDVVRGRDLFWSTSVHLLLQQLLGIPQPVYRHHRLIEDASGHKLSKSTQATALRELRGQGAMPADIRSLVGLSDDFRNTTGSC